MNEVINKEETIGGLQMNPSIYDMRPEEVEAAERIRREEMREVVSVVLGGTLLGLIAFALMMI